MQGFEIGEQDDMELDACRVCSVIWFDAQELERLGVSLAKAEANEIRRAKAQFDVAMARETESNTCEIDWFRDLLQSVFGSR